jgi:XTP/dITP diphosphohydrolase
MVKKVTFVTTNDMKFEEVARILGGYGIEIEQLNTSYEEDHDKTIGEIAKESAKKLAKKLNKPVIVDDTGVFIDHYKNFPGSVAKFVFQNIGYEGLFKLLGGIDPKGHFETAAAYCEPGEEPQVFFGRMEGRFITRNDLKDERFMPYMQIFQPCGFSKVISELTIEEKNSISHRADAFRKMGKYLSKK